MKRFYIFLLTVFLFSCFVVSSYSEFKSELIPEEILKKSNMISFGSAQKKESPFTKEPDYKGLKAYGTLYSNWGRLGMGVYAGSESGKFNTLLLDLDEDKDLTDETPILAGKVTELVLKGKKVNVRAELTSNQNRNSGTMCTVKLQPAEWYKGKVRAGKKEYGALMIDGGFDGLDSKGGDMLVLDLDQNNKFDVDLQTMMGEGMQPISDQVIFGGNVWDVTLDSEKPDLKLTPFKGDTGTLEIKNNMALKGVDVLIGVHLSFERKTQYSIPFEKGDISTLMPAGSYYRASIAAMFRKGGELAGLVMYSSVGDTLNIEKGKKKTLVLSPPKKLNLDIKQSGLNLTIAKKLIAGDGLEIGAMYLSDSKQGFKYLPEPYVEVLTTDQMPTVIASGKMEYG